MSVQRKIEQFRPLVESGYASTVRRYRKQDGAGADWHYAHHIQDHHVTLRIDVAALAAYLVKRAAASSRGRAGLCNGAISLKINTTKERE